MAVIPSDKKQVISFVGGGLIILGAFAIIMPGILTYVFSLWRIISLIMTVIAVAFLLVYIYHRLKPTKTKPIKNEPTDSNRDE